MERIDRFVWRAGDVVITDKDGRPVDLNKLAQLAKEKAAKEKAAKENEKEAEQ